MCGNKGWGFAALLDVFVRAKNVVFDVGQVLLSFRPEVFVPLLVRPEYAAPLLDNLFKDGVWNMMDEGVISDGDAARRIAQGAGVPQARADVLTVIERFHEHMETLPACALIPPLKAMGKRLYVLSNYGEFSFERTRRRFPWLFEPFDGLVISGREKVCKPDARIYRLLLDRYGLIAEETAFLDDAPANVAAARALGIDAVLYTGMGMPL